MELNNWSRSWNANNTAAKKHHRPWLPMIVLATVIIGWRVSALQRRKRRLPRLRPSRRR